MYDATNIRGTVLDILEDTLADLDSYQRSLDNIHFDGTMLRIGDYKWNLSQKNNVFLICGGKAANATAMALEHILGPRLTGGVVIIKALEATDHFEKCEVFVGGHPLPNIEGYRGCRRILEMVEKLTPDDLVISAISGGTSSLMSCPKEGLTIEEEMLTSDVLLKSGANIHEINSIRRHISQINGGNLAKRIEEKGTEMILLMHYDAIAPMPTDGKWIPSKITGGPMASDITTFRDAKKTINNYGLENKLPRNVVNFIFKSPDKDETPKLLKRYTAFLVNTLPDLCLSAQKQARRRGIDAYILTSSMDGSSKMAGTFLSEIIKEIRNYGRPFKAPCILIASGEVDHCAIYGSLVMDIHSGDHRSYNFIYIIHSLENTESAI